MAFARAVAVCLWKSVDFRGRSARQEFWNYLLFWMVACAVAGFLLGLRGAGNLAASSILTMPASQLAILLVPVLLVVPLPALAVRRLHDIGVSGWWLLSAAVPVPVVDLVVVGAQVVCFTRPGTMGENRYGPDPNAVAPEADLRNLRRRLAA